MTGRGKATWRWKRGQNEEGVKQAGDFTVPGPWYSKVGSVLAWVLAFGRWLARISFDLYQGQHMHRKASGVVFLEGLMLGGSTCRVLQGSARCTRRKERRSYPRTFPGRTALLQVGRYFGRTRS